MPKKTLSNHEEEKTLFVLKLEYYPKEYSPKNEDSTYSFSLTPSEQGKEFGFPGIANFQMTHLLIAPKIGRATWKHTQSKVSAVIGESKEPSAGTKYCVTANFSGKEYTGICHPILVLGHLYGDPDGRSYAIHWDVRIGRKDLDDNPNPWAYAYIERISPMPAVRKLLPLDPSLNSLLCLEGSIGKNYPGKLFVYTPKGASFLCELDWVRDITLDYAPGGYNIIAKGRRMKEDITEAVRERAEDDFGRKPDIPLEKMLARTIIIPFG